MRRIEIDTHSGTVRGVVEGDLVHWRGIPYAAPPVGPFRFRAPQPVEPWPDVRPCTEFGPMSAQPRELGLGTLDRRLPRSEDSLTLNVTAPAEPTSDRSPVMVFIHGGAYVNGAASEPMYDGSDLVRRGDVVYVSFNYRLGALGWMHFDAYATPDRPIESNLGLRDQIAALAWVRDNIAAFGGDPDNVTVFGESAGAISITTLLAVPSARNLFHRAISQSSAPRVIPMMEAAHRWTKEFLAHLVDDPDNHDQVRDALENADWMEFCVALSRLSLLGLKDEPAAIPVVPAVDGDLLPRTPVTAIAAGEANPVPLIIGTCDREGTLFSHFAPSNPTLKPSWRQMVTKAHSFIDPKGDFEDADGDELPPSHVLRRLYPGYPKRSALADLAGDGAFWYPSVEVMEAHSAHAPVFAYRYDFAPRLSKLVGMDATHASELLPLFGQMSGDLGRFMGALGGTAPWSDLSARMQDDWTHFARHGRPGDGWPAYDTTSRQTLILDTDVRVEQDPRRERREAWKAVVE
ncbi:carboxylesterase/lipase family protein [Mariniluteicoccus flavus]